MFKQFFSKNNLIYILLFITFFALRLYKIESLSPVISHDEVYYVTEARSLAVSGSDTSGQWKPWSLLPANSLFAELPGVIMTPAALLFPGSPFLAARFTHALFGSLIPLILAGIVFRLSKDKSWAITTAFLAGFNPWLFQTSRMGFDSLFSIFFYLLGIWLLLANKGWRRWWTVPIFILGFYQYQGMKIIFLPIVGISLFYLGLVEYQPKLELKKNIRRLLPLVLMLVFFSAFFFTHLVRLRSQEVGGRVTELIFFDNDNISATVNLERQQSIPNRYSQIFSNKATTIWDTFTSKYLASFDLNLLFIHGESLRNPFAVWSYGSFHLIEALFIVVGLIYLWHPRGKKDRRKQLATAFFIIALILISPLSNAINAMGNWIMFRSSFLFMWLIVLSGLGLSFLWNIFGNNKLKLLVRVVLVVLISASFIRFGYEYFFHYPVYGTNGKYFAERILSSYADRSGEDIKIIILGDESKFLFESIMAYSNLITKESIGDINQAMRSQNYQIKNLTVNTRCFDLTELNEETTIITDSSTALCEGQDLSSLEDMPISAIPSLLDSGAIFTVYNDRLCAGYGLDRFISIGDEILRVEKINDENFCQSFLIKAN